MIDYHDFQAVPFKTEPDGWLPVKSHPSDAAYDIKAAEPFTLWDNHPTPVRTNLFMALPPGSYALVLPRSGLAFKYGVTILNAPGLIDSGFRGELMIGFYKMPNVSSDYKLNFNAGDRIAQLLFSDSKLWPLMVDTDQWDKIYGNSDRGTKGFGSTGVS